MSKKTHAEKHDSKKHDGTKPKQGEVEGEGSYTATHNYDAGLAKSIAAGHSDELAQAAKKALEGPEGASLRAAEKAGKEGHPKQRKANATR